MSNDIPEKLTLTSKRPGTRRFYEQLTLEVMPKSSKSKVIITILSTIFLTLLINFCALFILKEFNPNGGYWLIKEKWRLIYNHAKPVDVIVLGDSSGNQSVIPEIIQEYLGEDCLNLSTIGNMGLTGNAWMLQAYINLYGPPKKVILVHAYDVWHRNRPKPALVAQIPKSLDFLNDLGIEYQMNLEEKLEFYNSKYFPLFSQNRSLKKLISNPNNFFEESYKISKTGFMKSEKHNPKRVQDGFSEHKEFLKKNNFKISKDNLNALYYIGQIAEKNDIMVYILNSPIYEGLYQEKNFRNYFSQLTDTLENKLTKYSNIYFINDVITFDHKYMENMDHVTFPAAQIFSKKLAALLISHSNKVRINKIFHN